MIEAKGLIFAVASFLFAMLARFGEVIAPHFTPALVFPTFIASIGFVGVSAFQLYMTLKQETKLEVFDRLMTILYLFVAMLGVVVSLFGSEDTKALETPIRFVFIPLLLGWVVWDINRLIQKNAELSVEPEPVLPVEEPKAPEPEPELNNSKFHLINRFQHAHVLGGTGSGKTQLLQYLISKDLEDDCTIVVIDNQRQMINKLARLGQEMALISPRYPLAINLFDRPRSDTTTTLLKYVLAGLMDSPLTPKQELIFEFSIQLMLVTPRATINTFRRLLDDREPDLTYINRLDDTAKEFFQTQFMDRSFDQTKKEISWRIWSLLKNPTLARMFTSPTNKVDIARELKRKLILIDCDVDTLQEYSGFFGRFFIAQLLETAQARFVGHHKPVYVYIDEAYFYFDRNIASMLETARKAKIGLIMAHQYLGQITEPKMRDAIMSLTSTKFASSLSPSDAYAMAQAMSCGADDFTDLKKLEFILWQRGNQPQIIKVPVGIIEGYPSYPIPDELMKNRYAIPEETPAPVIEPPEEDITPSSKL